MGACRLHFPVREYDSAKQASFSVNLGPGQIVKYRLDVMLPYREEHSQYVSLILGRTHQSLTARPVVSIFGAC
jgi:hypothetical protein